jgi:cyclopropane fatty-acyl-phospholipid synthase-like methyltransferase
MRKTGNAKELPKCQVAECQNPATWRCVESKLRYCEEHKHSHGLDEKTRHHYERLPEYWSKAFEEHKRKAREAKKREKEGRTNEGD